MILDKTAHILFISTISHCITIYKQNHMALLLSCIKNAHLNQHNLWVFAPLLHLILHFHVPSLTIHYPLIDMVPDSLPS